MECSFFRFTYISSLFDGTTIDTCEPSIHPMTKGNPHFSKKIAELGIARGDLEILYNPWQLVTEDQLQLQYTEG